MATGLTTLSFVIEKKEGLLDRSLTAGMSAFEILLAHVFTQLFVLIVQVTLVMVFALAVFEVSSLFLCTVLVVEILDSTILVLCDSYCKICLRSCLYLFLYTYVLQWF